MRLKWLSPKLKTLGNFFNEWRQSWKTRPEFILKKKPLMTKQVSRKFSYLNAFISGAMSVRTLLSILVGISGITSIAVYDTILNQSSPMYVSSIDSSDFEAETEGLLSRLSQLLSSQPEPVTEPEAIKVIVKPVVEDVVIVEPVEIFVPEEVYEEVSPPTGRGDVHIVGLFVLSSTVCIWAVIFRIKKRNILHGGYDVTEKL